MRCVQDHMLMDEDVAPAFETKSPAAAAGGCCAVSLCVCVCVCV